MANALISVGNVADPALADAVERGLTEHAVESGFAGPERHPLSVALRDADGSLIGGLIGETFWGWLAVKMLWVAKHRRGTGHGAALMARAEEEALKRGCHGVHLTTLGFQAKHFYEKLGYSLFGSLPDFPPGHTRYYLAKTLPKL
jgi:GNAT superfamily N-acetyltransferase